MIFIVGNSRSGTTMLSRILNNHSRIFVLKETHFYNKWLSGKNSNAFLKNEDAIILLASLISMQEEDYQLIILKNSYLDLSNSLIKTKGEMSFLAVFKLLANHYTSNHKKEISAEKTPQHVMHLEEITTDFPDAKIIHLYRDPRSVLLSQKNKINRDKIGGKSMPLKEKLRLFFNYNPIFHSFIWNSSIVHGSKNDVFQLCYETLVKNSRNELIKLCEFLQVDFEENIMQIPQKGSSIIADDNMQKGLHEKSLNNWMHYLSKSEILICQKICGKNMKKLNYEKIEISSIYLLPALFWILILPFQTFFAFLLNQNKIGRISFYLKNRFSIR